MKRIIFIKPKNKKNFAENLATIVIVTMLLVLYFSAINTNAISVFNYKNNDVIYNGKRDSKNVSLMFNVYWGTQYIPEILDVLDNFNVKTTFFVGGVWVKKEVETLNAIIERGHEIGNHGYRHSDQDKQNYNGNYEEIFETHKLVLDTFNLMMNLFAPPSGAYNSSTLQAAKDLGYVTIMWSKDTIDWRDKNETLIFSRATKNVIGGDLILAHPTEKTLLSLPSILEYYKLHGLAATTVTNCL